MATLESVCQKLSRTTNGRHRTVEWAVVFFCGLVFLFVAKLERPYRSCVAAFPAGRPLQTTATFQGSFLLQRSSPRWSCSMCLWHLWIRSLEVRFGIVCSAIGMQAIWLVKSFSVGARIPNRREGSRGSQVSMLGSWSTQVGSWYSWSWSDWSRHRSQTPKVKSASSVGCM